MDNLKKIGDQFLQLFTAEKEAEFRSLTLQIAAHLEQPAIHRHKWKAQRWSIALKTIEQKLQTLIQLKTEYSDLEVLGEYISTGEYDLQRWESRFQEWKTSIELHLPLLTGDLVDHLPSCFLIFSAPSNDHFYSLAVEAKKMIARLQAAKNSFVVLLSEASGYGIYLTNTIVISVLDPFSFLAFKPFAGEKIVHEFSLGGDEQQVSIQLKVLPQPFSFGPSQLVSSQLKYQSYPVRTDHYINAPIASLWGRLTHVPTSTQVEINQFKDARTTEYYARQLLSSVLNPS